MVVLENLFGARWILLLLGVSIYAANQLRKYLRLRQFRGPFGTGWSEIPHINAILRLRSHLWYKEITDRYGTIARVGPNDLITSSPELIMHMSAVRSPYTKTAWFYTATRIEAGRDHIFSQADEEKHTKRRQQMAAGYSGKENTNLEPTIDAYISQLTSLIRTNYLSTTTHSTPLDLAQKIQFLTLDIINAIGFGQAFGDLASDADVDGYIAASENTVFFIVILCATGLMPIVQWPPLAGLIGPGEGSKSGVGKVMSSARRLIDERLKEETKGKSDMLAAFMRHGLRRGDLFTESWLQIFAGSETTATAIRGTVLYVVANPRVYAKLQQEIDKTVAAGLAPDVVPDAVAKELVYLQAVLREGFRMRPPVTDVVPKKVPAGGDTVVVDGKSVFLPGGTNVGYSVNGLHSRKDIFGDDADIFRPERWIPSEGGAETERIAEMKKTTELIFGYGKYQCLGKNIGWMEYGKAVFELFRHFDIAFADPQNPWNEKNYLGIFASQGLWVLATERNGVA